MALPVYPFSFFIGNFIFEVSYAFGKIYTCYIRNDCVLKIENLVVNIVENFTLVFRKYNVTNLCFINDD